MQHPVRLPKMAASMTEATIIEWLKREGERVTEGEPLYQIETDKAAGEVESPATGVLVSILQDKGNKVPVNTILAWIEDEESS